MFTEGLDDNAIKWVKQGSAVPVDPPPPLRTSHTNSLLSPKLLPPPPPSHFHSGLLTRLVGPRGFGQDDDDDDESVASVDLGSSDLESSEGLSDKASFLSFNGGRPALVRGSSKENLRIEVPLAPHRKMPPAEMASAQTAKFFTPQVRFTDEMRTPTQMDMGTPSAPPILETEGEQWRGESQAASASTTMLQHSTHGSSDVEKGRESLGTLNWAEGEILSQKVSHISPRSAAADQNLPNLHLSSLDQPSYFSSRGQSAWQTLIAYDACFRLCLNAWSRECLEVPHFLRDECMLLRNAFGLQKYLLQPRNKYNTKEEITINMADISCSQKLRKVTSKVRVEVRKIRIIPRRKLYSTFSHRGSLYMEAGAQYVRHMSAMLKTRMSSLKLPSVVITSEEPLTCLVQLMSNTDEMQINSESAICLKPGTGDSHIFYPESQGDALLFEVRESNRVTLGRAIIQLSSLTNNPNDKVRWRPIYHEAQECVGKIQLSISNVMTSDDTAAIKSGPVVETFAYDLVLEAALRSEQFHSRNLRLDGPWKWLLTEFADYYGVTDAYTKLRYLSYVMNVATPTKKCLEIVHELLVPVIEAREEKVLTRQERIILLECESHVEELLASVFENYKSLDETSPTGFADTFGPLPVSAAPALVPAVNVYTLLRDILSQNAQETLKNYLRTAATKRCRRHMVETDELVSNNNESFVIDPMNVSTAYLKMKTLCINISNEIQSDIKIHEQNIFPSSIDLPNIAAGVYSSELCNRLRCFLSACPPSSPLPYVTELLVTADDFERNLQSWNIRPVLGGVNSKNLFNHYIMVWIEDKRLSFLELCKADKAPWSGITTHNLTSPFVEDMYDRMRDMLDEYEVVVNRWPQYAMVLENAIACIERAVVKTMEKQFSEILAPLKDSIPKKLGIQVQKLTRRQSLLPYNVPAELGIFLSTVKRILEVLHCRLEEILKPWASCLPIMGDRKSVFGEQLNEVTVMLRTKYKNYMQATVEKLVGNAQTNKSTRLKRILEETKEADGQMQVRDRMQLLCSQLIDTIQNLHDVFPDSIFIAVCRGFWERMGQIILSCLESRKENRVWLKGSYYALGVLDDIFASQMQRFQGNALQEKDLEAPRSVKEARSILCRDSPKTTDKSTYFNY